MNTLKFALVCVVCLSLSASVYAKGHETYAANPSMRKNDAARFHKQAQRARAAARKWARRHGQLMRRTDGFNTWELMGLRNGRPVYYKTLNADAAISTADDLVRDPVPYNLTGQGVTVGVWDAWGVMVDHQEFGGRVTYTDPDPYGWGYASSAHSTHVGGTIAAAGVVPRAKGMAPAADIDSYDWYDDMDEMTIAAAATGNDPGKIYLSNHSYGGGCGWEFGADGTNYWYGDTFDTNSTDSNFGKYTATYSDSSSVQNGVTGARDADYVVYHAPYYLPFVAAGNDRLDNPGNGEPVARLEKVSDYWGTYWTWVDAGTYSSSNCPQGDGDYKSGYDTINGMALGKNVMTVGAVKGAVADGVRSLPAAIMTSFSSWGPVDDGRIKPDIVADGYNVYSCIDSSTSSYASHSGTSMATPNACGSAALLVGYYEQLTGTNMLASTLKGLIIHTADDLGNPGPDYTYGWGLMNTVAAAALINDYANGDLIRMHEGTLYANPDYTTTLPFYADSVFTSAGVDPIRVTLCWTDPPGDSKSAADDRTPDLVNDLDVLVWGPNETYYPYSLDYLHPTNNATATGPNHVDNVEQVYIQTPVPGEYTVYVYYSGALTGDEQKFSLLISGTGTDSDGDGMTDDWEIKNFLTATGAVATADADNDGEDNLGEYISGNNPNDSTSVFKINSYKAPTASGQPFIINWDSVSNRVYNILGTSDLKSGSYTDLSGDLPAPIGSYTTTVQNATQPQFYRVNVRIGP